MVGTNDAARMALASPGASELARHGNRTFTARAC
jgi:hypothetical protein